MQVSMQNEGIWSFKGILVACCCCQVPGMDSIKYALVGKDSIFRVLLIFILLCRLDLIFEMWNSFFA
jgi:hypothetical protein